MTTSTSPGPKGTVPEPPPVNVQPRASSGGAAGLRAVADTVRAAYGDDAVLTDRQQLRTYECDGLAAEGVLLVTAQMRKVLAVRPEDERAVVQPGVINLEVTGAAAPHGYYFAPDPSSQQVCSIGGNVAENSGGAHCLKYGFTTNHVLAVEMVTPQGDVERLGTVAPDAPGYDLLGTVVGSEGTLGVVTEATVKLVRKPEAVRTLLAGFETTDAAGAAP